MPFLVGSEAVNVLAWLYTTLHADAALLAAAPGDVQTGMAEDSTLTPYTIVSVQSPPVDAAGVAGIRLMSRGLYQVAAIGPVAGYAALVTANLRIDALLQRASGLGVLSCVRKSAVALDELVNGVHWTRLGGLYEIISQ